ncbi:hypothetical protein RZO55_08620 [Clostridium boliviensis]|uniref:Large polyvalent protein associated domain-containing protein n=1 Tax=Clostridium boliviensis TaxID=318465 RepID=A0ABU4GN10_9CLOT|nr:hypothetical protein [Clostridium boliviensis]MDW2797637.1 hypothetical protein [Clostridium boliviensis]
MNRKENGITNPRFTLRPASSGETNLFYALSKDLDEKLGTVGHLRIDFGSNGHEFWHTWWPRDYERPYSSAFESDLKMVVDALRDDGPLESFSAMQQYCAGHSGKIEGGWQQNYGYVIETEHYRYCLRCNPAFGDYQAYLTVYGLQVQQMNLKQEAAVPNETAEQINEHEIKMGGM